MRFVRIASLATAVITLSAASTRAQEDLDIVDTAAGAGIFNTLVAAVQAAELVDVLKSSMASSRGEFPWVKTSWRTTPPCVGSGSGAPGEPPTDARARQLSGSSESPSRPETTSEWPNPSADTGQNELSS